MGARVSESVSTRIHEQDFCAQAAKWAGDIFKLAPTSPFGEARIEGFGSGKQQRKRKDLRFYDENGKVALTGEVKLLEMASPHAHQFISRGGGRLSKGSSRGAPELAQAVLPLAGF